MATTPAPYMGEIRMFPVAWAPQGWALCDGSVLPVQQYQALFSLLGTVFGGNGQTTFGLPDLRGRVPTGWSPGVTEVAAQVGAETVTLTAAEVPAHTHLAMATSDAANALDPSSGVFASIQPSPATDIGYNAYAGSGQWTPDVALAAGTVQSVGSGQAHSNMQPFAVVNYAICLSGTYPTRPGSPS